MTANIARVVSAKYKHSKICFSSTTPHTFIHTHTHSHSYTHTHTLTATLKTKVSYVSKS